jgi:hypothetical protein
VRLKCIQTQKIRDRERERERNQGTRETTDLGKRTKKKKWIRAERSGINKTKKMKNRKKRQERKRKKPGEKYNTHKRAYDNQ